MPFIADWRSLSQVKELGIAMSNCPTYAQDVGKIFEEYWMAAATQTLPFWPVSVQTNFNMLTPMYVGMATSPVYVSSGPQQFAPTGRVNDLDAILSIINNAKKTLNFAIMDYIPASLYYKNNFYWPVIDDALRSAAFRGVKLQLLFSVWNHTKSSELPYWRSLNELSNVQVKTYRLPDSPYTPPAPFSRVSHSKYIVTENQAYISTSNCAQDYYISTGGVSVNLVDSSSSAFRAITSVFDDDWSSLFAGPIPSSVPRMPQIRQ